MTICAVAGCCWLRALGNGGYVAAKFEGQVSGSEIEEIFDSSRHQPATHRVALSGSFPCVSCHSPRGNEAWSNSMLGVCILPADSNDRLVTRDQRRSTES